MARTPPAKPHNTGTHLPIGGLTALRGLAALYIISLHHFGALGIPIPIYKGHLAVDFFFLLSGFILMHVYGATLLQTPTWHSYKHFFLLRLARIYPAHILSMAMLYCACFLLPKNPYEIISFHTLYNLLLVQAWGFLDSMSWNYPAWSLSAEWFCYLMFPLLCWLLKHASTPLQNLMLYGITILLLQGLVFTHPIHSLDITSAFSFARAVPEFLQGMLLYRLYLSRNHTLNTDLSMLFGVCVLLFLLFTRANSLEPIVLVPMALILLSATKNEGFSGKFLNSTPLVFLGNISLSLYLFQAPVFAVLKYYTGALLIIAPGGWKLAAGVANFFFYYGILIVFSWYIYTRVELPVRNFVRKKLADKKI